MSSSEIYAGTLEYYGLKFPTKEKYTNNYIKYIKQKNNIYAL